MHSPQEKKLKIYLKSSMIIPKIKRKKEDKTQNQFVRMIGNKKLVDLKDPQQYIFNRCYSPMWELVRICLWYVKILDVCLHRIWYYIRQNSRKKMKNFDIHTKGKIVK